MKNITIELSDEDYARLKNCYPADFTDSEMVECAIDDHIEDHELYLETKEASEQKTAADEAEELAHKRMWNEGPVKVWPMFIGDLRYLTDDPAKENWTMEKHINSALMKWITVATHVYRGRPDYAFELLQEYVPAQPVEAE